MLQIQQLQKISQEGELWKEIPDTNSMYYVSTYGRVYSMHKERLMKLHINDAGYQYIRYREISTNKERNKKVHRLVAQAFIPNQDNKVEVNHIDGIKVHNSVTNLEWVTRNENINHAFDTGLHHNPKKPVICVELGKIFPSVRDAGREMGILHQSIYKVCRGICNSAGGYTWRYVGGEV